MIGYIYILWNPCLNDLIKIGFSTNVEQRLKEINASTVVPSAFRLYATYETEKNVADKIVHRVIDILNPNLRMKEIIDGKERVREFFSMTKEDALQILSAIAVISGTSDRLCIYEGKKVFKSEDFVGFYNRISDGEINLFSECIPSISEFISDDKNLVNKFEDNNAFEYSNYKYAKKEIKLLEEKIKNLFISKSVFLEKNDFSYFSEWYLVGVRFNLHFDCDNCGGYSRYFLLFCNNVNKNEILLCRDCFDLVPGSSYCYMNDINVLDYLYKVRKDMFRFGDVSFCSISVEFLYLLYKAGCISKKEILPYIESDKEYPFYKIKRLSVEEKIRLQDFCTSRIVPFLKSDFLNDWRFSKDNPPLSNFSWKMDFFNNE